MRPFPLIVLSLSCLVAGCASQPASDAATGSSSAVAAPAAAPAAPSTTAAPATAAPSVPAAVAGGATAASTELKAPPGYKLAKKDGQTVYCQKVTATGSRYPKMVCLTPAAYEDLMRNAETDKQNFRKNTTLCGTGGCGGG